MGTPINPFPDVDALLKETYERHKDTGLDDLSHYMDLCAVLGRHARMLETHNRQLLEFFEGKPGVKRPFSDALANSVITAQVQRISELEKKLAAAKTDLDAGFKREADLRQYLPSGDDP